MLSAARRQAKLAKRAKAQKERAAAFQAAQLGEAAAIRAREAAAYERQELLRRLGEEDRLEDVVLLIQDKHEELHGGGRYSAAQIREVNAIIAAYTPDEFDTAVALANYKLLNC